MTSFNKMDSTLQPFLSNALGLPVSITSKIPLSGGDINQVSKIKTNEGNFCIKQNDRNQFPKMFEKEALGLKELSQKSSFRIPEVIGHFEDDNQQYLILEFLESGHQSANFWSDFGAKLAALHQNVSDSFSWKSDNYIGSLPQKNDERNDWARFYAEMRILPQLKMAFDNSRMNSTDIRAGEKLCLQFDTLFPKEAPALVHGDLWSGNYMTDASGNPVLIDPAVYYGHREMDLGMMHLFGGFSQDLFDTYHAHFPLENNWRERIPLTQLYPLLVHVNLFGGSYVQSVRSIFQKYS